MRPLRRIPLRVATALSVSLLMATILLWVRSYRAYDYAYASSREIHSLNGRVAVLIGWPAQTSQPGSLVLGTKSMRLDPDLRGYDDLGLCVRTFGPVGAYPDGFQSGFVISHWALACLFGLLPAWAAIARYRWRRRRLVGLCPACGYDLRATPERCPECGTVAGA